MLPRSGGFPELDTFQRLRPLVIDTVPFRVSVVPRVSSTMTLPRTNTSPLLLATSARLLLTSQHGGKEEVNQVHHRGRHGRRQPRQCLRMQQEQDYCEVRRRDEEAFLRQDNPEDQWMIEDDEGGGGIAGRGVGGGCVRDEELGVDCQRVSS